MFSYANSARYDTCDRQLTNYITFNGSFVETCYDALEAERFVWNQLVKKKKPF